MSQYDSGELPVDQPYTLQKYTFTLQSMYDDENDITGVTAKMTHDGQTEVQGIDIEGRVTIDSWCVNANNTEAIVNVSVKSDEQKKGNPDFGQGPFPNPVSYTEQRVTGKNGNLIYEVDGPIAILIRTNGTYQGVMCSTLPNQKGRTCNNGTQSQPSWRELSLRENYTYKGKTAYYHYFGAGSRVNDFSGGVNNEVIGDSFNEGAAAWTILYGEEDSSGSEKEVGQFQIYIDDDPYPEPPDPGDNWEEPESTGDPDYTLKVKIIGALSGRHNDPLHDTSVSFTPADQISVKGYGGGGDGGHGGGGGAGASTIIVRRFVTDKAGSIEVTAISKRHGYGSGGGKGGRGGDGCILVFY